MYLGDEMFSIRDWSMQSRTSSLGSFNFTF